MGRIAAAPALVANVVGHGTASDTAPPSRGTGVGDFAATAATIADLVVIGVKAPPLLKHP